jgi:hypothetical protein
VNNWDEDIGSLYRHTIEMEQLMEFLLAEIRAKQAKTNANLKETKGEMNRCRAAEK